MDRKSVLEVGKVLYHSGLPFRVRLFNILLHLDLSSVCVMEFFLIGIMEIGNYC